MSRPGGFSRNLFAVKNLTRSRWAAIGAAVAVTLGGGGLIGVSASETSSTLTPVSPVRVVDTRPTGKVGNIADGASITVQITGAIKTVNEGTKTVVPDGASAIIGNLTLAETHANDYGGFATVYPCGDRPEASNVNFTSGQTIANSVAVPLSITGTVCIYVYGTAHVLLDVSGYYTTSEISEVAARVSSIETNITEVQEKTDEQATKITEVEQKAVEQATKITEVEQRVEAVEEDTPTEETPIEDPYIVGDAGGTQYVLHSFTDGEMIPVSSSSGGGSWILDSGTYFRVGDNQVFGVLVDGEQVTLPSGQLTYFYFESSDCSGTHYVEMPSGEITQGYDWAAGEILTIVPKAFEGDTVESRPIWIRGGHINSFEDEGVFTLKGDPDNTVNSSAISSWYDSYGKCDTPTWEPEQQPWPWLTTHELMPIIPTEIEHDIQFPLTKVTL